MEKYAEHFQWGIFKIFKYFLGNDHVYMCTNYAAVPAVLEFFVFIKLKRIFLMANLKFSLCVKSSSLASSWYLM